MNQLHVKRRGAGPLLLVVGGGDGDADSYDALAEHLQRNYCVVTYDRRGQSRSPASGTPLDIHHHADDAAELIASLGAGPVDVFGTSLGALIGLELAYRHPEQIRTAIAHEPPLIQVLDPDDRALAIRQQLYIERVFQEAGLDAAMRAIIKATGVDLRDREPGARLPTPSPNRRANLIHMLTVDAPAARSYRIDVDGLDGLRVDLRVGAGERNGFPRSCAAALAAALGLPLVAFPGGHTGYATHPVAFAEALTTALTSSSPGSPESSVE